MRSPLEDDIPSGRLLRSTPTIKATLTPPRPHCESEDEGLWYAIENRAEHDGERRPGRLRPFGVLSITAPPLVRATNHRQ